MCMVYIKSLVRISFRAADAYFVLPGSFIFYHSINVQYVRKKREPCFYVCYMLKLCILFIPPANKVLGVKRNLFLSICSFVCAIVSIPFLWKNIGSSYFIQRLLISLWHEGVSWSSLKVIWASSRSLEGKVYNLCPVNSILCLEFPLPPFCA